ncbi:MAG TPA: exodeoxyribonuclease V subunit gamma, partial [Pseudomonas sp.]|nr:exodeoxyribonuclease V subunit gamma [Pseudomonas sp.]
LEALLAAREQLYVSWVGRSIRDNSERPASVLVGQLRDHLASGWTLAGGGDLLHALTTEHPLQPFSRDYFSGADPALFSYAREWAELHRPASAEAAEQALPPFQADAPLSLETLQSFLRDPVKHFFTQRLKVHLDEQAQAQLDEEPFGLDGLQRYQLQQTLLGAASLALEAGEPVEPALQATALRLQRSGQLPLAGFGARLREQVLAPLPAQMQRYQALCALWPDRLESPRQLQFAHAGVALDGWLGGLRTRADGELARIELQPGELKIKDKGWKWHRLLRPWVAHVAAAACGVPLTSLLVGEDASVQFAPLGAEAAQGILRHWLEGCAAGLNAPLPVALQTAIAWLQALEKGEEKAREAARTAYEGDGYHSDGEVAKSASLARQYPDFTALGADGDFPQWSQDLYQPLLQAAISEPEEEASA